MRAWVIAFAVVMACGRGGQDAPAGQAPFALAILDGREVPIRSGEQTLLLLTVVGALADEVTYTADGLPPWATLEGDLITFAPGRSDTGAFDVTVTATAGAASDSKRLHLLVSAKNRAPFIVDTFLTDPANHLDVYRQPPSCMLDPVLHAYVRDLDGDRSRLEIEAVTAGTPFTGIATHTADQGPQGDGMSTDYVVPITGLAPGQPYAIAYRAVDALGAASLWTPFTASLTCVPIGITAPWRVQVYSNEVRTVEIDVYGVDAVPWTLTASGLPSFATLSGRTLTVAAPVVEAWRNYEFTLTLASGGYVATFPSEIAISP
jgi:hypothetical protein